MGPRVLAITMAGAFFALVLAAGNAAAQEEGPSIISESVESRFLDGELVFKVTASGPDPIEHLRISLKTLGVETKTVAGIDITPGNNVTGEYTLNTSSATQYVPPGTVVRYSYEIRDSAGRVVHTPEREVVYQDDRFEWLEVSQGLVIVYYYGGSIAEFVKKRAEIIADAAARTVENMSLVLGIDPVEPIRVEFYNNYRDMNAALPFRSQAVRQDLQTQGQAWPADRVVLVLGDETTVAGITSHELTHILVAEAAGQGYSRVPAWLNEGLAEYGNVDRGDGYTQALLHGIYTRQIKPLWYLSNFGGEPEDIIIAYGQGSSVVSYLIAFYGTEKIAELMRVLDGTRTIDDAMMEVYGFDQHGLDTQWRLEIGLDPLPSPDELEARVEGGTPTLEATPEAEVATPDAIQPDTERQARSGSSCGRRSSDGAAAIPLGMVLLGLMIVPLAVRRRSGNEE